MTRYEYLLDLIGKPWGANQTGPDAWDCYHLARHVQRDLFGLELPLVEVPEFPKWTWMLNVIAKHPERKLWHEVPRGPFGVVTAADGALVLMARLNSPAHIGVWFTSERRVLHSDHEEGVVFDDLATLNAKQWRKLYFMERVAK